MLIRGQTTEDRIAEIAQGFGQGVQNFQQVQNQQRAQDLQAEALKRQQALQSFEVENKIAEQTGKIVPRGTGLAILSGQNIDLAGALKSAPSTRKAEKEDFDKERARSRDEKQLEVWDSTIAKNNSAAKNPNGKNSTEKGIRLKPSEISKFNEGNAVPLMLNDLESTISSNADIFGPVAGRTASLNPYNEKVKTAESQITAATQAVGKYLEGGVLRAEDVPKYKMMLPNLADTPEVAANKLANVRRLLVQRQNSDLEALKGSGYDVSSIDKGLIVPSAPAVLGNKPSSNGNQTQKMNVGHVEDGYQYLGGDPADPASWKKA